MHHNDVLRELMIQKDISVSEMARRLKHNNHVNVMHSLQCKDAQFDKLLDLLEAMDYELVIRRKREGNLPDGEYALRRADYEAGEAQQ